MGDLPGTNEEPQKNDAIARGTSQEETVVGTPQEGHAEQAQSVDNPAKKPIPFQHVIITLADGRRGVFLGPELIKAVEFKPGVVPRPVAIDFEPPREFSVPVTKEEVKEELTNADTKEDAKPAAGLE